MHSKHSGTMHPAALRTLKVQESYSEPQMIYDRLLERGMSMVTITDHDCVDGCLEIMHHGEHVFMSEEVSARFPENGCVLHVLVYGIDEAQHREIQRLRYNIYDLLTYLRQQEVVFSLAHPFSQVNHRLTPELLHKAFILFENLEVINGQKDPSHERLLRQAMDGLGRSQIERWANEYDIEPAPWDKRWGMTAGSDDHSGITMARAFVEFDGPARADALRAAITQQRTRLHSHEKTGKSYGHTAYVGTLNFFAHSHPDGSSQSMGQLMDIAKTRQLPADEDLSPLMKRLVPAVMTTLAEADGLPTKSRIVAEGHKAELHDEIYDLVQSTLLRSYRASFEDIHEAVEGVDIESLIDELPTLLRLTLFNLPYYFGYNFFYGERRRAQTLFSWLNLDSGVVREKRVAIFADTLEHFSGVSLGLRKTVDGLRKDGHDVWLCGPETRPEGERVVEEGFHRFPCLTQFPIPGYADMTLGWPSLLEVVRWLDENEIDLIQISTPGPAGLMALAASRILGIPVAGHFHTDVPAFTEKLIKDPTIGRVVTSYVGWFYRALGDVIVPTHAAAEVVGRLGVPYQKLHVVRRGVDSVKFDPALRDPSFWRKHGLSGQNTLLFVGRVSVEKNLPFLGEVFRTLLRQDVQLELGVVGDGPWLETMKKELEGYPVAFTGYLEGDELSTAVASSDLLIFPSTTDTFGNAVIESLASGIPALVSDVGGPSELVRHNETGWILPAGDQAAWVDAISRLMRDPQARAKAGAAARAFAEGCTHERARRDLWSFYDGHIQAFRAEFRREAR